MSATAAYIQYPEDLRHTQSMVSIARESNSILPPLTWMQSASLNALRPPIGNQNSAHWRLSVPAVSPNSHSWFPHLYSVDATSLRQMRSIPSPPPVLSAPVAHGTDVPAFPLEFGEMVQKLPIAQSGEVLNKSRSSITSQSSFEQLAADIQAQLLFDCASIAPPLARHAEYLGGASHERAAVREHYFENFDLSNKRLDQALRIVGTKLLLRGETQRLDRVLSSFSKRYIECNPHSILRTQDATHTVAFSLLLLNTDLHLADMQTRMTRKQFIKNTLASLTEQPEFSESSVTPLSSPGFVRSVSSQDSHPPARSASRAIRTRKLVRHFSVISRREIENDTDDDMNPIQNMLRNMYFSIRHDPIPTPTNCPPSGATISPNDTQGGQTTWRDPLRDSPVPTQSFEIEEPLAMREESPGRFALRRPWVSVRGTILNGTLHLFKHGTRVPSPYRSLMLQHAYTTMSERQINVFQIVLARGEVYSMRASSISAAQQWIQVCNYWAARTSKPRLRAGLTNVDYGWKNICPEARRGSQGYNLTGSPIQKGARMLKTEKPTWNMPHAVSRALRLHSRHTSDTAVSEWMEPSTPYVQSTLTSAEQATQTAECLASIRDELEQHDAVYAPMQAYWAVLPNSRARAMSNWERKRAYLERELIKYAQYAAALQDA